MVKSEEKEDLKVSEEVSPGTGIDSGIATQDNCGPG
jgi:hypothetical protein